MGAGRARIVSSGVLALGLLVSSAVIPTAAATCALSAPPTVTVGTPLIVIGYGFPASTRIDVSIGLRGRPPDEFAIQSDGAGDFRISFTPEGVDAGETTILATAGTTCSAQAVVVVTGATIAPSPQATPAPSGSSARATGNPPRTDAVAPPTGQTGEMPTKGWELTLLIVLIGVAGLLSARRALGR